jgi:hypothetical protein
VNEGEKNAASEKWTEGEGEGDRKRESVTKKFVMKEIKL